MLASCPLMMPAPAPARQSRGQPPKASCGRVCGWAGRAGAGRCAGAGAVLSLCVDVGRALAGIGKGGASAVAPAAGVLAVSLGDDGEAAGAMGSAGVAAAGPGAAGEDAAGAGGAAGAVVGEAGLAAGCDGGVSAAVLFADVSPDAAACWASS